MPSDVNKTPDEVGTTTPRDLHPTSDIRFVIVETAKLTERVNALIKDGSEHKNDIKELLTENKNDIRKLLYALIAGFLVLAGMMIAGYLKMDDRSYENNGTLNALSAKVDALSSKAMTGRH